MLNGTIHTMCTILKVVTTSAAVAEVCTLFFRVQEAKVMQLTLQELGNPQLLILIYVDNTT